MPSRSYSLPNTYRTKQWCYSSCGSCSAWCATPTSTLQSVRKGGYSAGSTQSFHRKLKSGALIPPKSYHRWDYRATLPPGGGSGVRLTTCSGSSCTRTDTLTGSTCPTAIIYDSDTGALFEHEDPFDMFDTQALLVSAVANIVPDFDFLTTAVEAHKTFHMIRNVRRDARDLIVSARAGGKMTAKAASNAWLAWRYGWRQLGYDIQNVSDFIRRPVNSLIVSGQAGDSDTSSETEIQSPLWTPPQSLTTVWNRDVSVRARAVAKLDVRTLNTVMDIPTTAWELIPYSFVADWLVNVGEVISAWYVERNVSELCCSLGYKRTVQATSYTEVVDPTPYISANFTNQATELFEDKKRIPASRPSLVPRARFRMSSANFVDLAALLTRPVLHRYFRL